jgi:hypothetical protein
MIFAKCGWVRSRRQRSVNVYKNKKRWLYTNGETIHKTIQKHGTHKIQNKKYKTKNKHKKNIKKRKLSN